MITVLFWTLIYSLATAASITLLGSRDLISGNLFSIKNILNLALNYKFIISMVCAIIARLAFILTNNAILKIPKLSSSATTITTFITLICLVFVVAANIAFLGEKIRTIQILGAGIIMVGIIILLSR